MVEEWRDIVIEKNGVVYDYSGLYQISNMGRVRSLNYKNTGEIKVLKLRCTKKGYLRIALSKNKEQQHFLVHRLVATAFIENDDPINKTDVNHISEVKTENFVWNLEWVTHKENANHGTGNERRKNSNIGKHCGQTFKDKKHTEETKRKMSEAHNKKVVCIETGQEFDSIREAEKWCGITGGIGLCCKGKLKTAGGYHWKLI